MNNPISSTTHPPELLLILPPLASLLDRRLRERKLRRERRKR
jgi:hypothetical protein